MIFYYDQVTKADDRTFPSFSRYVCVKHAFQSA